MPSERMAPIFIIADDDRSAIERLIRVLHFEWFYIPIWEACLVVRYAAHFATTAVFLADEIDYPEGGSARLLQQLLDQVGKPVVILTEAWNPEQTERWKRMGAADCIPHPTRFDHRAEGMRAKMQEFALQSVAVRIEGRELQGPGR